MNRRGFFQKLAVAAAGFSILPPATTYSRVWKAVRPDVTRTMVGIQVCSFSQFLIDQIPKFDQLIMEEFQNGKRQWLDWS